MVDVVTKGVGRGEHGIVVVLSEVIGARETGPGLARIVAIPIRTVIIRVGPRYTA
jgi:hypothetical protein